MNKKSVACALLIRGNRILLQDRKHISKYGEEWLFFGGGIEAGETPREALIREIREELGVDITDWEMRYLGEIVHYTSFAEYHRFLFGIRIPDEMTAFADHEGSGAIFLILTHSEVSNLIPISPRKSHNCGRIFSRVILPKSLIFRDISYV